MNTYTMSIHNLLVPNNLDIFAKSITADTFNIDTLTTTNLNVSGDVNIGGDLDITGNTTSDGYAIFEKNVISNGDIDGNRLYVDGYTSVTTKFITRVVSGQSNIMGLRYDGVTIGASIANALTTFHVQRINNQIYYNVTFNVSMNFTIASLLAYPLTSFQAELRPIVESSHLLTVKTGSTIQTGKVIVKLIGGVTYLIVYPNSNNESELFPLFNGNGIRHNITLPMPGIVL